MKLCYSGFFLKKKETTTTIKATYFQAKKKSLKFL